MIISRYPRVAANGTISFLFMAERCSTVCGVCVCVRACVCTHRVCLICSSVAGHLGGFHVLGAVRRAAASTGVRVSVLNYGFLWMYVQEQDCWIVR